MSWTQAVAAMAAALAGAVVTRLALSRMTPRMKGALNRVNVRGRPVPATGGIALALGTAAGTGVAIAGASAGGAGMGRVAFAVAAAAGLMFAAGLWDDLRGDERARGFKGHLRAAASGTLTGGLVKIAAGLAAGAVAGVVLGSGRSVVETMLLVALAANFVNLLDRAPGRAGKAGIAAAVALTATAPAAWVVSSAAAWGALAAVLPADLAERVMLGDSGANAIGAVAGVGLALALPEPGRIVAIVILLTLTAASERWSFSRIIESTSWLRRIDEMGRLRE